MFCLRKGEFPDTCRNFYWLLLTSCSKYLPAVLRNNLINKEDNILFTWFLCTRHCNISSIKHTDLLADPSHLQAIPCWFQSSTGLTFAPYTTRADIWEMFIPMGRQRCEGPAHSSLLQQLWAEWAPVWAKSCPRCHSEVTAVTSVWQRADHPNLHHKYLCHRGKGGSKGISNGTKQGKSRFCLSALMGQKLEGQGWNPSLESLEEPSPAPQWLSPSAHPFLLLWETSATSSVAEPSAP